MVKQVRVIRNVLWMGGVSILILWFARTGISIHYLVFLWGLLGGVILGLFHWNRLSGRIQRTDRNFERNKIFVRFISPLEVILMTAGASHYLLIGLAVIVYIGTVLDWISGFWWSALIGSFGIGWSVFLILRILVYERNNGPVYYQYDSRTWMGSEALLYQSGEVVQPLRPSGKVRINGELWNAVSLSGEEIDPGESIEVISRKGLTLYVDRMESKGPNPE